MIGRLWFAWFGVVLFAMACGGSFGGWAGAYGDDRPGWVMILTVVVFTAAALARLGPEARERSRTAASV